MENTVNLCAQIPTSLMAKIREEQELSGLPRGEYITQILKNYYENGGKTMDFTKTLAFQIPEALFNRIKDHLEREKQRTGRRLSQKDFVIGLIEQALDTINPAEMVLMRALEQRGVWCLEALVAIGSTEE